MNKHQQSGMTTLLITSMLLIVALLFSLASYKNLFYQIKRTQNEVLARQAHWAAEGGLECGFAEISNKSDVNTSLDKCKTAIDGQPLTLSIDTNDGKSLLTSETSNKYKKIVKTIVAGGTRSSGVIKSSADLYFNGESNIFPDPNNNVAPLSWECSLLRYKNNVYLHRSGTKIKNIEFEGASTPPMAGFDLATNKCVHEFKTNDAKKREDFASDIRLDSSLDLFQETFGVARSQWQVVKDKVFVDGNKTNKTKCIDKITASITTEKRHVWIEGDCKLDSTDLSSLPQENDNEKGIFILVHNGVLEMSGSAFYKAVIYHFNHEYVPLGNKWTGTFLDGKQFPDTYTTSDNDSFDKEAFGKKVVAHITGSHRPTGGFMFDTPEQVTYFQYSGMLTYDGELIKELLAPFGKPRWQQGSWHDF
ncbi:hypothetical protein AYY19_10000 [Photobacterium aquimaris]|uniref:Uncharacterized protein n=1 Tax=Photobacterium aquimaris TaxID=512643 RepID=A0A2T3IKP1_9GAMM|nr:hypothetical protein [Photobacterium aquimaris]OBU10134.1 hypothetical protein AYY19_10000 [Photobacterium aquimaris]OBU15926.1 hypothetical protein AYY20_20115 [Photobacterium aquimaris]PSU28896.1 hypothetical protein CTM88_09720 [Photobacterium aquimaris]PSW00488.1 hypothetical protein CTM91_11320 [Photobacterium aquimaris]